MGQKWGKNNEIVHQANDMISVEWDDLYIVMEMGKTCSGMDLFRISVCYLLQTLLTFQAIHMAAIEYAP